MSKFYGIKREGGIDNISVPISPPYFAFSKIASIKTSRIRGNGQGVSARPSITEGKRRVKESRNQEQKISERNCSIKKQLSVNIE